MYTVPIITSTDLRHEETIIQAANALQHLHNVIKDVFNKIDHRIEKNYSKIDEIQKRIESANSKINSLVNSKKAIKIFSPAKFPAAHVFCDIPITFDQIRNPTVVTFDHLEGYEVESGLEPMSQSSLQDKLQFFHVIDNANKKSNLSKILDGQQGLGEIPRHLTSVNSLLLYNTTKNVYSRKTDIYDPREKKTADRIESSGQKIEAAPHSLSNRKIGDKKFNQRLFYTPKLNEAPTINLPVDLPDLPGIAGDVQFDVQENERIAPSSFLDSLPDLPEPEILEIDTNFLDRSKINNKLEDIETVKPPPSVTTTLSPPKQLSSPASAAASVPASAPVSAPVSAPPPPPPPPPISPIMNPKKQNKPLVKPTEKRLPPIEDARSNLMDAIRKGKALKSTAASEINNRKDSNNSNPNEKPAANLMDDLHNKLMMRRKGISGSKENQTGGTVLDKLANLIPPPPKQNFNQTSSDNSSADEWID